VLATRHMSPWRVLLWFKFTEMVLQCRLRAISRDARLRHAMRCYTQMGRRVLPCEILNFLRDRLVKRGPTVAESGVRRRTARRNRCRRPSPSVARRRATQPRPRPSLSGCRGIIY
jgi:anaerobic magnesium-protoporphyrin IX monomethyl ester cyclase